MLHTKFRENRPAGSGEEDFWRVFTIYVTQMPRTNFRSPYPRRLHIKSGFDRASGFKEKDVWNCGRRRRRTTTTTDGRTQKHGYTISSPISLWPRWAKKDICVFGYLDSISISLCAENGTLCDIRLVPEPGKRSENKQGKFIYISSITYMLMWSVYCVSRCNLFNISKVPYLKCVRTRYVNILKKETTVLLQSF